MLARSKLFLRAGAAFASLACVAIGSVGGLVLTSGCGSSTTDPSSSDAGGDAGSDGGAVTVTLYPEADPLPGETECKVVVTTNIKVGGAVHVPVCTPVAYATNPPSGGDHWGIWAAYKQYTSAVPREVYVHDLEHGAVVLSYRCEDDCPDVVAALDHVYDGVALDPLCAQQPTVARILMTPDDELPAPIAASAWGATYVATCIDEASLKTFVGATYGRGTESTCASGQDVTLPGVIACDGGAGGGGAGGSGGAGGGGGG